ncbi:MAG TPA: pilus assembly protein [Thermomicrobiales bacterium]|nr:pilus assembly protein [Thermomicrobiales bacterium]HRA46463.1 pilus assembly protein [Thermomicrobiales bacterium]
MVTRIRKWRMPKAAGGFTLVEFALTSVVFLLITMGTIDLGRAVYLYSEMNSAVRDAAREAKVSNANGYGFSQSSVNHRVHVAKNQIGGTEKRRPGFDSVTSSVSCTSSCQPGDLLTVTATMPFSPILTDFLGIDPFAMHASATVKME